MQMETTPKHPDEYFCMLCGDGKMIYTGKTIPGDPVYFQHECTVCGDLAVLSRRYDHTFFSGMKFRI